MATLASCGDTSAVLLKNPDAISLAVMDGIAYSLIGEKWSKEAWQAQPVRRPASLTPPPLCRADQLSNADPQLWGGGICWLAKIHVDESCQNVSGCVGLEFDSSVLQDPELAAKIHSAAHAPCRAIPDNDRAHLNGFMYPPDVSRSLLGCESGKTGISPIRQVQLLSASKQ